MRDLLAAAGRPLAAPSANASGRISPTRAEHVLASLGGRIPLIVDGGPTAHGLEIDHRRASTGGALAPASPGPDRPRPRRCECRRRIEAPGQLASHYAPAKPLRLDATDAAAPDEWLIGFGAVAGDATLSASGDLVEAAASLFERLHEAEAQRPRRASPSRRSPTTASASRSTTACAAPPRRGRHEQSAADPRPASGACLSLGSALLIGAFLPRAFSAFSRALRCWSVSAIDARLDLGV